MILPVLPERLATKFSRDFSTGCWLWTGAIGAGGYGNIYNRTTRRVDLAHRTFFEIFVGPIPAGMHVDHVCRVRRCVYFGHLRAVTPRENLLAGIGFTAVNAAKTHCPRGHEYNAENTLHKNGGRLCRLCWRERYRTDEAFRDRIRARYHANKKDPVKWARIREQNTACARRRREQKKEFPA